MVLYAMGWTQGRDGPARKMKPKQESGKARRGRGRGREGQGNRVTGLAVAPCPFPARFRIIWRTGRSTRESGSLTACCSPASAGTGCSALRQYCTYSGSIQYTVL